MASFKRQEALQAILDHTFKRVLTRDRVPDDVRDPKMVINRCVANPIVIYDYNLGQGWLR